MIEHGERVVRYLGGRGLAELLADDMRADAVVRAVEVMGEACKRVPSGIKDRFPEIPWRLISANRDQLIRGYATVAPARLWDTAANHVPVVVLPMRRVREEIAAEQPPPLA